jgi:hypothetical protein
MIQVRHLPRNGVWLTLSLRPMPFVPAFAPVRGKSRNFQRVRNMKSPRILSWGKLVTPDTMPIPPPEPWSWIAKPAINLIEKLSREWNKH